MNETRDQLETSVREFIERVEAFKTELSEIEKIGIATYFVRELARLQS